MQRRRGRRERRGARRKDGREGRHSPSRALAGGRSARGGQPGGRVPRRSSPPTRRDQRSGPRELSAEAPREPPKAPRAPRPRPSALRRRSGSALAPRAAAGGAERRPPPVSAAHRPEHRPPPVTTAHRPEHRPRDPPAEEGSAAAGGRGRVPGCGAPGESRRGDSLWGLPLHRAGVERSSRSAAPPRPCSPVDLTWGVPPSAVGCLRAFPALGWSQGSCLPGPWGPLRRGLPFTWSWCWTLGTVQKRKGRLSRPRAPPAPRAGGSAAPVSSLRTRGRPGARGCAHLPAVGQQPVGDSLALSGQYRAA